MEVIVLSGPADRAAQARSMLQQNGLRVEDSVDSVRSNAGPVAAREYNHGFEQADGEAFITVRGDLADWQTVEALGFQLRLHWTEGTEGEWVNPKQARDPIRELDLLTARLKAAGIVLPEAG